MRFDRPIKFHMPRSTETVAVLACLALCVLVAIVAQVSYHRRSTEITEVFQQHSQRVSRLLQSHTTHTLLGVDDALRQLKYAYEKEGARLNIHRMVDEFASIKPFITAASITNDKGDVILSTTNFRSGTNIGARSHFLAHINQDHGGVAVGIPIVIQSSGESDFQTTRRINGPDGRFDGVVSIGVGILRWEQLVKFSDFEEANALALVGTDGITRVLMTDQSSPAKPADPGWAQSIAKVGPEGPDQILRDASGDTWVAHHLKHFPLVVAIRINSALLETRLAETRKRHLWGALSVMLLLIVSTAIIARQAAHQRREFKRSLELEREHWQSGESFRLVFEQAPLGMTLRTVGQRDQPALRVNQQFCDFLGYTSSELLSVAPSVFNLPEDELLAAEMDRRIMAGEVTSYSREKLYRRKDGTTRWGLLTATVLNSRDGKPAQTLTIVQDINHRKLSEEAIRESEERLRIMADQTAEGLALYDKQGRLVFFNNAYRKMLALPDITLGMPFEQITRRRGQVLLEMGEITDVEAFVQDRLARHRTGTSISIERKRKDGSFHLIREANSESGYTVITFVDVTELRQREEALRASESRFRAMFDHAGIGITMRPLHDRHHPWESVNDRFCEMTGFSREELLHMSTADITGPDGQDAAVADNTRLVAGEVSYYTREKQIRRKNGELLWVQLSVASLPGTGKVIATYQDIHARKLAEQQVAASEQRLRMIFDNAGIGIAVRSIINRDLPWDMVNDRFCEIIGYSREEVARISTSAITLPEDTQTAIDQISAINRGDIGHYTREKRIRRKNGDLLWVQLTVTSLIGPDGRRSTIAIYQDIHARKLAEERVKASEEHLRAIITAEPECVATVTLDGRLSDINPAGLAILSGTNLAELQQQPLIDYAVEEYRRPALRLLCAIRRGRAATLEIEARVLDGTKRWLEIHAVPMRDADGRPSALLGIAHDVTERRSAREALAAERNLLRTIIDNIPDHIHVKDRDLRFVLANAAWVAARPYIQGNIIGKTSAEFASDNRIELYEKEDREVLDHNRNSQPRELIWNDLPDGPRWFVTSKTPLRDPDDNTIGVVGISRDITDYKRRSIEFEKLNAALEERVIERTSELSSVIEELDAFASAVSHDLRAPLRNIHGLSDALLEDYSPCLDNDGQYMLRRIGDGVDRMRALIEDLLRLSQVARTTLRRESVNLSDLAAEVLQELHQQHRGHMPHVRIEPGLLVVGDTGLLRTALTNLLGNAWKFSSRTPRPLIEVGRTRRNHADVFFVRDNGAGFDMAFAYKLFSPFQRLHSERDFPGTGVGLATVRRIMRRHGGDVWADAAEGRGATFYFSLTGGNVADHAPAESQAALPPVAAKPPLPGEPLIALMVDDDADALMLIERMLRRAGFRVRATMNVEQALLALAQEPADIVISDFSMPAMTGAQFLQKVQMLYPDTLRVILSGQDINDAMAAGLRSGAIHGCFHKNQSLDKLVGYLQTNAKKKPQTT